MINQHATTFLKGLNSVLLNQQGFAGLFDPQPFHTNPILRLATPATKSSGETWSKIKALVAANAAIKASAVKNDCSAWHFLGVLLVISPTFWSIFLWFSFCSQIFVSTFQRCSTGFCLGLHVFLIGLYLDLCCTR